MIALCRLRHRRRRSGFTLIEVVIATALTTALVVVMMRWIGTMGLLAALGAQRTDPSRVATVVERRFVADAYAATGCDEKRNDGPVHSASPTQVTFWLDDNGDGNPDPVVWSLEGSTLYRTVYLGNGGCTYAGGSDKTAVADGVRATNFMTPWYEGSSETLTGTVNCQTDPEDCLWDALQLRLVIEASASDVPVALDVLVPLNTAASGRPTS